MDELYLVARRVLLDALAALGPHRDAVVLVGAQAVYLRVGEADIAVAPYTTDGDLAIDPAVLAEIPPLEQSLLEAGFFLRKKGSVGEWATRKPTKANPQTEVVIDLLVPASVSPGEGRRAASLPGHDKKAARIVHGLEGALIDADVMALGSLELSDERTFDVRVAGPAALLVAKVHKIKERSVDPRRQKDKDALDILRLLRGVETADLATRYQRLLADERSSEVAASACAWFRQQFAEPTGEGIAMAVRSVGVLADAAEIAASCEVLANDLLDALGR
ncbi:MAG TPA: hypothetical protein VFS43_20655 [Polyangiaceae bacterium]|nr:hypothetical protein [Polyangiaceae bacterium]